MEFWPLKTLSEVPGVLLGLQLSLTPNMGVHLGVWGFIPSHSLDSLHSREHVMWLPGLLLGPQPRNLLALVASQMLGLRQRMCSRYVLSWSGVPTIMWNLGTQTSPICASNMYSHYVTFSTLGKFEDQSLCHILHPGQIWGPITVSHYPNCKFEDQSLCHVLQITILRTGKRKATLKIIS
jgi:hypothetical protein